MAKRSTSPQQLTKEMDVLRENEEKLQALMRVLPVGVSILGEDRKPIYTNPALEKVLGLSENKLKKGEYGRRKYLRSDGSEMPVDEFPSARAFNEQRAIRNVEIGIVKEDGDIIWTMVSAVPFERGDWRVLLTVADITRQKYAENSLQKRTDELLERIKELNCLYGIADLVEQPGITLDEILQGTAELMPPSWRYPGMTSARIVYDGREYVSKGFKTSEWKGSSEIFVHAHPSGSVEVFYTGDVPVDDDNPFLEEEYSLLRAIAERLGRIIERLRAEQLLVKLATTDPLTGLFNRRHFFDLAEMEIARSKRYGHPLACIMFDIDFFKRINDSFGHLFGDRVLKGMVWRCRETIRQVDIFARYGGDEFVILLPETGRRRSKQLADRLCTGFKNRPLKIDEREIPITLSMGVASVPGSDDLALDILLNRADQALYIAKEKGRNQVFVWQEIK
ncbi:MAG: diguanylate cyclase [Anaerolineales bacterium]|nr:diguanylate cyclase [Anaerolineales bacterium]